MKWAYGITTVPNRVQTLLPRTLESLANAGFDKPILFVDGVDENWFPPTIKLGGVVLYHPKIGHIPNWQLALLHLYSAQPSAERYALFEDDLLATKGLRDYLDDCPYPERGYWNLITHPENLVLTNNIEGWHLSNQKGKGAVGLVFNRETARAILSSHIFLDRPLVGAPAADGMVIDSLHILGYKEYIHCPTLIQHIGGGQSTMAHKYGEMPGWRGEDFDLTTIDQPEKVVTADGPRVAMSKHSSDQPSVKVIIPTQKSVASLQPLIQQIQNTAGIPCEVYITSSVGSAAFNRNLGLEWAKKEKAEWVCMVDDDCAMHSYSQGWLAKLAKAMERTDVVFASATLYKADGTPAYMTGLNDCGGMHQEVGEWECPTKRILTACCAFKPHGLKFDETFIGSGFEDTDFCNQLSNLKPNGKFIICFTSKIIHNNEMKEQRNNWDWNRLVYQSKWEPRLLKPIIALYKTYRGGEWFEASLESIKENVAGIVVVTSEEPWSKHIDALPENCLAPLKRFMARHPEVRVEIVTMKGRHSQRDQYAEGMRRVTDAFGPSYGVLIIDSDEVWEDHTLRILRTAMTLDPKALYFRSRVHNYIKFPWWRISPQEPHRPVVGLKNSQVPYIHGRFCRAPDNTYRDLDISYHHFPLVRREESEIMHKLLNTSTEDGPCHQDWIERVWNNLPAGKNIHPAISYERCWKKVEEVEPKSLPILAQQTTIFCEKLATAFQIVTIPNLEVELIDLPRFHRQFNQIGMISGLVELLKEVKPEAMVEVGAATGESTEIACQLAKRVWAVDIWEPDPVEPDLMYENEEIFDLRTKRFTNLTKIKKPSVRAANKFKDGQLDLVYIDAKHDINSARADINAWLPKVKPGGYLAGHDFIWHGEVREAVTELLGPVKVFQDTSWLYKKS
jgi:hypothetical protein